MKMEITRIESSPERQGSRSAFGFRSSTESNSIPSARTLDNKPDSSNPPLAQASTNSNSNDSEHMFLSEHDLVSKRRVTLTRAVYSGVDPVVLKGKYKDSDQALLSPEDGEGGVNGRSDLLPIAD